MKKNKIIVSCFVFIVSLSSCEEDTFNATLVDSQPPSEVEASVTTEFTDGLTAVVGVVPRAEGASSFQVIFDGQEPMLIGKGISVSNEFALGDQSFKVIAIGPDGKTTEFTKEFVSPPFAYLYNFEIDPLEGAFDFGAPISIIDNPFPEGLNQSEKVLEVNRGTGAFQGSGFNIPALDLTTETSENKVISVLIYSDKEARLSIDLAGGLEGARAANVQQDHTGTGWERLEFNFEAATKAFIGATDDGEPLDPAEVGVYEQIVFIFDGDNPDANIFYFDEIVKAE